MDLNNHATATEKKADEIRKISIRTKLIIIFGLLVAISSAIQSFIAINKARTAIKEKIEIQLTEKAKDVSALINSRIEGLLNSLQAAGNMPLIKDPNADAKEILAFLNTLKNIHPQILRIDFCDTNGIRYSGTNLLNIGDRDWYKKAMTGKSVLSEPIVSRLDGSLVFVGAAPVYDDKGRLIRIITATIKGTALSKNVDDIIIGKTGNSYVIDQTGTIIAHKDIALVESQTNSIALSKTDSSYKSLAEYTDKVVHSKNIAVGSYTWKGEKYIACDSTMALNGWTIIVKAPASEMFESLYTLINSMIVTSLIVQLLSICFILFIAQGMVKPVRAVAAALKEIANGKGDLTVRLKLIGNDEVTEVSHYFNETIAKIGTSIKSVGDNSDVMQNIGEQLQT